MNSMRTQIENHPNNLQLKQIIETRRLSMAVALTIFNRGRSEPITESTFKSWLAEPESPLWRQLSDADLHHGHEAFRSV